MRWFRFYAEALNDPKVQQLPPALFKRQVIAATEGEENLFSKYIKRGTGRPLPEDWPITRKRIFARDDFTCQYCGRRGIQLECDHIVPVTRGGGDEDDNLATACFTCNRSKRDKMLEEWRP